MCIRDRALDILCGLPDLQELSLFGTQISNDGIHFLDSLPDLHTLDVGETNLDDRSVPTICQLSRLRNLGLFDTKISDSGLSDLSGMSDLQSIEIGKTLVTEKGVAQFKLSLPNCIVEHDVYPAT